jgi:hypothetical protein
MGVKLKNIGKGIKNTVSNAQRQAQADADRLRDKANEARRLADEARKRAEQKVKDAANAVGEVAKKEAKRLAEEAKRTAENAKKIANNAVSKVKDADKKVKKRLKDLSGKVRKAYKKLLQKTVLKGTEVAIKSNASGIASRLYPAIASSTDIKAKKMKASFVPTSKTAYAQVLSKWKGLGGTEAKLNAAIKQGISVKKFGFSGEVERYALPYPNNSSNFVQTPNRNPFQLYSGADGTGEDVQLTAEEQAELDNYGIEEPAEKQSGIKAFVAWIKSLFHKKDSPYEEGSAEDLALQASTDDVNYPELADDAMNLLKVLDTNNDDPADEGESRVDIQDGDDGDNDDTIWGMNKYVVYGGSFVLIMGAIFGTVKLVQFIKKK